MTTIHQAVQERYGAIAENQGSCCGGSSCNVQLYDETLTIGLPEEVTGLSLGCGDPVTIASLKAGESVLDLGSGGGIDCFMAAKQVGSTGYVIGVDMTPAMLHKANASKVRMEMHNVEFRRGMIEDLPVVDNSIDVVMSNCVINLSPDKRAVFGEAFRVLKSGGRVAFSDIVTDSEFSPELQADLTQWSECVTGAIPADVYLAMMQEVGFVDVAVVDKSSAEAIAPRQVGMPQIFSARITATKP